MTAMRLHRSWLHNLSDLSTAASKHRPQRARAWFNARTVLIRNTGIAQNRFMANPYRAPLTLIRLALNQAAELAGARALSGYEEVLTDLAEPILENAARFACDVLSPLNPGVD